MSQFGRTCILTSRLLASSRCCDSGQWLQLPAAQKEDGSSIPLFSDDARNLLNKLMHLGALTLAFSGQVVKFLARTEKELCAQITTLSLSQTWISKLENCHRRGIDRSHLHSAGMVTLVLLRAFVPSFLDLERLKNIFDMMNDERWHTNPLASLFADWCLIHAAVSHLCA